jgi:hypothetical protein
MKATSINNSVTQLIQSTFLINSSMAASGTKDGEIILWEKKFYPDRESKEIEKEAMKTVK